ncbi:hypothetical protein HanOQP8_Chr15g0593321 [Helianthus annuus]|nr:hypothetical protein HanOQP8_Chr15g0593321 [Helianthus annuus]
MKGRWLCQVTILPFDPFDILFALKVAFNFLNFLKTQHSKTKNINTQLLNFSKVSVFINLDPKYVEFSQYLENPTLKHQDNQHPLSELL